MSIIMLVHKNKWRKIKKENEYEKTICPVLSLLLLGSSMPVGAFAEGNNLVAENSSVAETTAEATTAEATEMTATSETTEATEETTTETESSTESSESATTEFHGNVRNRNDRFHNGFNIHKYDRINY